MTTLPQLNTTPKYKTMVPSTGKKITYRPYLVKEEKVLMIAFETGEQKDALLAIVDTIQACVQEELETNKLTTFDIEYLFTQIRGKSVGEKSTILLPCSKCEVKNEVDVVISDIQINVPKGNSIIQLTDDISVEMRYPPYISMMEMGEETNETEVGFRLLAKSVSAILTSEERYDVEDSPIEEVMEFIEQMTTEQFEKISQFLRDMPAIEKEVEYMCTSCGHGNKHVLRGMNDFLS